MYDTDQEQIEAIKQWWSQFGNYVIGGIAAFILAFVGFNYYQSSSESHRLAASAIYEELLLLTTSEAPDADQRKALTDELKQNYADLGYGAVAAMIEAKAAVDAGDFTQALVELEWARSEGNATLLPVILYRIAMIHYAQDDLAAALSTLEQIPGEGHEALTEELRGDILLEQGDIESARAAFETAYQLSQEQGISNPYLKMKVDDLAVAE